MREVSARFNLCCLTREVFVFLEEKDKPVLKKFAQVYQSPEVKDFINKTFDGAVIAAW